MREYPSVIYAIQCTVNGKVYIGCTAKYIAELRVNEHINALTRGDKRVWHLGNGCEKTAWQQDFDKYGADAFVAYIMEEVDGADDPHDVEAFYIRKYKASDPDHGYNIVMKRNRGGNIKIPVRYGFPEMIETKEEE